MLWGSINEDSALVTYLNKLFSQNKEGAVVKETGIWFLKDEKNQIGLVLLQMESLSKTEF